VSSPVARRRQPRAPGTGSAIYAAASGRGSGVRMGAASAADPSGRRSRVRMGAASAADRRGPPRPTGPKSALTGG